MRLNQYIASGTKLSRRSADEAIQAGRVRVNGLLGQVGARVSEGDEVMLDGRILVALTNYDYIIFHKPVGYVTSRVRQGSAPTIYELIPPRYRNLQAVGRLDKDSSGLLLLTNDGAFAQRLSHPSYAKQKIYKITLKTDLKPSDLKRLGIGIELEDGPSRLEVIASNGCNITVGLSEGRNRQLRRTFAALGYRVKTLHRTNFGQFELGELGVGAVQSFTPSTES